MSSPVPANINRGLMSKAELAQTEALAARGFTAGRIAQRLNRHPATVSYAMHRLGLRVLKQRQFSYIRNGVLVKSFTAEEDAALTSLRIAGVAVAKIADELTVRFGHRRSAHSVNMRLVMLSNVEAAA